MFDSSLSSSRILSKEQLAAIGCVAIESTYAEIFVEEIIWDLCGLDDEHGKHLTDKVSMKSRLELLSRIGKQHTTKLQAEELTRIVSDFKIANEDRNTTIHGVWIRYAADGASPAFLDEIPDPALVAQAEK